MRGTCAASATRGQRGSTRVPLRQSTLFYRVRDRAAVRTAQEMPYTCSRAPAYANGNPQTHRRRHRRGMAGGPLRHFGIMQHDKMHTGVSWEEGEGLPAVDAGPADDGAWREEKMNGGEEGRARRGRRGRRGEGAGLAQTRVRMSTVKEAQRRQHRHIQATCVSFYDVVAVFFYDKGMGASAHRHTCICPQEVMTDLPERELHTYGERL